MFRQKTQNKFKHVEIISFTVFTAWRCTKSCSDLARMPYLSTKFTATIWRYIMSVKQYNEYIEE